MNHSNSGDGSISTPIDGILMVLENMLYHDCNRLSGSWEDWLDNSMAGTILFMSFEHVMFVAKNIPFLWLEHQNLSDIVVVRICSSGDIFLWLKLSQLWGQFNPCTLANTHVTLRTDKFLSLALRSFLGTRLFNTSSAV